MANTDAAQAAERWPQFTAAATAAGYQSAHALPLRLRRQIIGVMSLFCMQQSTLSNDDLAVGQALADVATISLLQERAVREEELLAEQLQGALNSRVLIEQAKGSLAARAQVSVDHAFTMMRDYGRQTRQPLSSVAAAVIDGSIDSELLLRK